jgi:hypothetical protein
MIVAIVRAPLVFPFLLALAACLQPYEARHEGQWNSTDQVLMSEASQVKLRAAQSRVFDTTDRKRILTAVVATLQDLGFMIKVLDEELGIVSGKRFEEIEGSLLGNDASYHLYDSDSLLAFSRRFMGWGPFYHRDNLVRVTVTVRKRNEGQSVVRASAQYYLCAVEDPEPFQRFFRALEQAMFLEAHQVEDPPPDAPR